MKKSQEVSLKIAKLLTQTIKKLKDLIETVTTIRIVGDIEKTMKNSNLFY